MINMLSMLASIAGGLVCGVVLPFPYFLLPALVWGAACGFVAARYGNAG